MEKSVAPLNVSPSIKAARWTFLILGIFYGTNRLQNLKAYEEKVSLKRKQELHEKYSRLKEKDRIRARDDLYLIGKDCGAEFEPGWDSDL